MGFRTNGPGCGCCTDPCTIGTDTFDTDLSQFATTGSPSVSAGSLLMSSGDRVIFTPEPATDDDGVRVQTFATSTDATSTIDLIGAWTDANNHIYGRRDRAAGVGTIQLFQILDGETDALTEPLTLEDTGSELDGPFELRLCIQPGETVTPVTGSAGNYAGDGTGTSWTDPTNVTSPSGGFAEYSAGSMVTTNTLTANTFGFSIPARSTIDGIAVNLLIEHDGMDVDFVDSLVKLVDRTGSAVGDNKATMASLSNLETNVGWGGDTDDWNAGLTWRDIRDPDFGVIFQFTNNGNAGNIRVRGAAITVWYTTPDRGPARVQFTYTNTASPFTVQCQTAFDGYSDGKKTGISTPAGDWSFSEFNLHYLQHDTLHPTCPECDCPDTNECDFCDPEPKAFQRIDLGSAASLCMGFSLEEEYILEPTSACTWLYIEETPCASPDGSMSGLCGNIIVSYSLQLFQSGGTAKWVLVHNRIPSGPGGCGFTSPCALGCGQSIYESAEIDTLADCQTYPVTLTRFSGTIGPASITLDEA